MSSPPDQEKDEHFEALIDLLATDDLDDDDDHFYRGTAGAGPSNLQPQGTGLRRPDGRLDYGKIRDYFQVKKETSPTPSVLNRSPVAEEPVDRETPARRSKKPPMPMSLPTPQFSMTAATTHFNNGPANNGYQSPTPGRRKVKHAPRQEQAPERTDGSDGSESQQLHTRGASEGLISISPLTLPPSRTLLPVDSSRRSPSSSFLQQQRRPERASPDIFQDRPPSSLRHRIDSPSSETSRLPDFRFRRTVSSPITLAGSASRSRSTDLDVALAQIPDDDHTELVADLRRGLEENRLQTVALTNALTSVRAEADALRRQCQELQILAEGMGWTSSQRPPSRLALRSNQMTVGTQTAAPAVDPSPTAPSFDTWTSTTTDPDYVVDEASVAQGETRTSAGNSTAEDATITPNPPRQRYLGDEDDEDDREHQQQISSTSVRGGRDSPPMDEIELMSGVEAREMLRAVLTTLHILPNTTELPLQDHVHVPNPLGGSSRPSSAASHIGSSDPTSLADVVRAIDFVRSIDRVVWRKLGRRDEGGVFGERNVKSLLDRVEMWEDAMRRPVKVPVPR